MNARTFVRNDLAVGSLPLELGLRRSLHAIAARLITLAVVILASGAVGACVVLFAVWPMPATLATGILVLLALAIYVHARGTRRLFRSRSLAVTAASLLMALTLPLLTIASGLLAVRAQEEYQPYLTVLLVLMAFTMSLFNTYRARRTAASDIALVTIRSALVTALATEDRASPVVRAARRAAPPGRSDPGAEDDLIDGILDMVNSVCGRSGGAASGLRSTFYRLEDGTTLRLAQWKGRVGKVSPRQDFVASRDPHDHGAVKIAKGTTALLVRDLDSAPPEYFADYQGREYRSLITVPVRGGGKSYGILTVDSDQPNAVTDIDVGYMLLLSAKLAGGISQIKENLAGKPSREARAVAIPGSRHLMRRKPSEERERRTDNIVTAPLLSEHEFGLIAGVLSREEYLGRVRLSTSPATRRMWASVNP